MFAVFIDFADAFGSVDHDYIFQTLEHFGVPRMLCCLVEDLYKYSYFEVLCGFELSDMFYIIRGTNTGDPLSALCFILVIDRICLPMVEYAIRCMGLINEEKVSPLPAQAFADDIVVTSNNEDIINGMFAILRGHT